MAFCSTRKTVQPEAFRKEGYYIAGWNKDETKAAKGTIQYKYNAVKNAGLNTTLYAVWKPVTYKVIFHINNGGTDKTKTQTLTYDKAAKLTANSFKWSKHTFLGWSTGRDSTEVAHVNKESVLNLASVLNEEVHLYAVWS